MWIWYLAIVIAVILVVWWSLSRQARFAEKSNISSDHASQDHKPTTGEHGSDDLTIIEGIGPKISSILINNGIETFVKLSETSPLHITEILSNSDPRLGRISKPDSWPEQARLAANKDMENLQKLQDRLKGGRE